MKHHFSNALVLLTLATPAFAAGTECGDPGVKCLADPAQGGTEIYQVGSASRALDCARLNGMLLLRAIYTHEAANLRQIVRSQNAAAEFTGQSWFELSRLALTRSALTADAVRSLAHELRTPEIKGAVKTAVNALSDVPTFGSPAYPPAVEGGFETWQQQIVSIETDWANAFLELQRAYGNLCVGPVP